MPKIQLGHSTMNEKTKVDIDAAVEHILWCARYQLPGYIEIQTLKPTKSGSHIPTQAYWLHNNAPDLRKKLRITLTGIKASNRMVLYTACSYSRQEGKAEFALPSRLAFVDADEGVDPSKVPAPSRRVASSATGEHWFYVLSQAVPSEELQRINKSLTQTAGGDHGHSAAKKFRLPGFPNLKYKNRPLVKVIYTQNKHYDPNTLCKKLSDSRKSVQKKDKVVRSTIDGAELNAILRKLNPKLDNITSSRLRQKRIYGRFTIRINGKICTYPGDNRSDIIWGIGMGLRDAGATSDETRRVIPTTIFWKDRESEGRVEDIDRLVDKIYSEGGSASIQLNSARLAKSSVLNSEDPTTWAGLPIPEVEWILNGWIPFQKVTLLYGDGGTGKTLLALMLAVSCAIGLPFLGMSVRKCRAYAFLAENDTSDTHRTLADICRHYRVDFRELYNLRVASQSGIDNVLMAFKEGKGEHTVLFNKLLEEVKTFGAQLVILETAADLFGGNENYRTEVRAFLADCCGRIAREINGAVLLNAHPSAAGMRSGVGDGGSTAWNNTVRSRLSLYREKDADNSEEDTDIRILEIKKSNFSKTGEKVTLRWKNNVYINENPETSQNARNDVDEKIIAEIRNSFEDNEPWSSRHQSGPNYIVSWIKGTLKMTERAAKTRLNNLLHRRQIVEVIYNKHLHRKGLCTPDQAEKLRAKQSAKVRNKDS